MYCQFQPYPKTPGRFLCKRCNIPSSRNKTYGPEGPPPRHCPILPEPRTDNVEFILKKDIISKSKRYLHERDIWQKAGKPVRSDEEIFRIFTEVCSKCEHFNKKSEKLGSCKVCGCYLKPKGLSFNKIAWATTTCPASQPKWIAEVVLEEEQQNKKKLEQNLWQEQDEKQQNGLKMKEVANSIANNPVPPKKRGGCCGK